MRDIFLKTFCSLFTLLMIVMSGCSTNLKDDVLSNQTDTNTAPDAVVKNFNITPSSNLRSEVGKYTVSFDEGVTGEHYSYDLIKEGDDSYVATFDEDGKQLKLSMNLISSTKDEWLVEQTFDGKSKTLGIKLVQLDNGQYLFSFNHNAGDLRSVVYESFWDCVTRLLTDKNVATIALIGSAFGPEVPLAFGGAAAIICARKSNRLCTYIAD